jgi:hypothetical protein
MNRKLVVKIAEELHLSIIIKPDGRLVGFPVDIERLREEYIKRNVNNGN